MEPSGTTRTPEYEAFKRLAKGLVAVPKKEVPRPARKVRKKRRQS